MFSSCISCFVLANLTSRSAFEQDHPFAGLSLLSPLAFALALGFFVLLLKRQFKPPMIDQLQCRLFIVVSFPPGSLLIAVVGVRC
jgi:hypothetical protein